MQYLCFDTCTWIYLANGTEPVKLLNFVKDGLDSSQLKLILPCTIIDEWNSNKNTAVKNGALDQFNKAIDGLKKMSHLLGEKSKRPLFSFLIDGDDKVEYFDEIIEKIKSKKEQLKTAIQGNIDTIESIFTHSNTIKVDIKTDVKLLAGEFALLKKAPFKNRNSFADALIVLSFIDYCREYNITESIFVSYNTEDFCEKKELKKLLHTDLVPLFKEINSSFFHIVGEAINSIEKGFIDNETISQIEEFQSDSAYEPDYICQECDGYHGFGNEVYFDTIEIENELLTNLQLSDNQLELEFARDMPRLDIDKLITSIEIGSCNHCSKQYLKCQNCGTITLIDRDETNIIECDCGIVYGIEDIHIEKDIWDKKYKILDKKSKECEKCGESFIDIHNTGICNECNEEYNCN